MPLSLSCLYKNANGRSFEYVWPVIQTGRALASPARVVYPCRGVWRVFEKKTRGREGDPRNAEGESMKRVCHTRRCKPSYPLLWCEPFLSTLLSSFLQLVVLTFYFHSVNDLSTVSLTISSSLQCKLNHINHAIRTPQLSSESRSENVHVRRYVIRKDSLTSSYLNLAERFEVSAEHKTIPDAKRESSRSLENAIVIRLTIPLRNDRFRSRDKSEEDPGS